MLIVVIMGGLMIVRVELSTMSGVKCVRHRGDDVCCSVVCCVY